MAVMREVKVRGGLHPSIQPPPPQQEALQCVCSSCFIWESWPETPVHLVHSVLSPPPNQHWPASHVSHDPLTLSSPPLSRTIHFSGHVEVHWCWYEGKILLPLSTNKNHPPPPPLPLSRVTSCSFLGRGGKHSPALLSSPQKLYVSYSTQPLCVIQGLEVILLWGKKCSSTRIPNQCLRFNYFIYCKLNSSKQHTVSR